MASAPSSTDKHNFTITGDLSADFIKNYSSEISESARTLLNGMSGIAKYDGLISFSKAGSETKLKLNLDNWASTTPMPLKKQRGASLQGELLLQTFAKKTNPDRLSWSGNLGSQLFTQGALNQNNDLRYAIGIGGVAAMPSQGLNLGIQVNELNCDTWLAFLSANRAKTLPSKYSTTCSTTPLLRTSKEIVWSTFDPKPVVCQGTSSSRDMRNRSTRTSSLAYPIR